MPTAAHRRGHKERTTQADTANGNGFHRPLQPDTRRLDTSGHGGGQGGGIALLGRKFED
jgi:hypothetical protein